MFDESRARFWTADAAGRNAFQQGPNYNHNRLLFMVTSTIPLLGALMFALLSHYSTWSFIARVTASLVAIGLTQYLLARLLKYRH